MITESQANKRSNRGRPHGNGMLPLTKMRFFTYKSTGDASKALKDGAVSAQKTYAQKARSINFDGIERYEYGDKYWNNFFVNTDRHGSIYDSLGFERPFNGYLQKESGLDSMINSWNDLMEKVTSDSSAFLNKTHFTAYA